MILDHPGKSMVFYGFPWFLQHFRKNQPIDVSDSPGLPRVSSKISSTSSSSQSRRSLRRQSGWQMRMPPAPEGVVKPTRCAPLQSNGVVLRDLFHGNKATLSNPKKKDIKGGFQLFFVLHPILITSISIDHSYRAVIYIYNRDLSQVFVGCDPGSNRWVYLKGIPKGTK